MTPRSTLFCAVLFAACNTAGGDKDDTDATTDASGDTDDTQTAGDTDVVADTDVTDTDAALVDVSGWSGNSVLTFVSGAMCGVNSPPSVNITGASTTTFVVQSELGSTNCTFTGEVPLPASFTCDNVVQGQTTVYTYGEWDGATITVSLGVAIPSVPCSDTAVFTMPAPTEVPVAQPGRN